MKRFLVFLSTITVAVAVDGFEPDLRVKFGRADPGVNGTYLFNLPRSVENATAAGWESTPRPPGPLPQLIMYCPADKVVCCLYDDTGYIAGVQVALSKSEFSGNVFDWEKRGFTSWETTVEDNQKEFWTQQQYFVDNDYLKISKENRVAFRDYSRTLQAGAVWVTGINKELLKVSNQEKYIVREQRFLEQACIPALGKHYFYNMSTETKCTYDQMYPWFLMYKNGELSAIALLTFGKLEEPCCSRYWVEHVTVPEVKVIIPYGPECMYQLSADPGALTMHFFFVDKSWDITCPA